MSRKKGRGLEYNVAPDLVRSGADPHREGAEEKPPPVTDKARSRRLDYEPTPFPGAHAPPGPAPRALASLKAEGMLADDGERMLAEEATASRTPASAQASAPPPKAPLTPATPVAPPKTATTAAPSRAPGQASAPPPKAPLTAAAPPKTATTAAPSRAPAAASPREHSRPAPPATENHEVRVARTVRLAPNVDAQVQTIASRFGVDLTAAISIAVTHGYQALASAGFVKSPPTA